uniref:Lethal protein 858 n=1 Tax=Panagrolaimus davidi TaxID=227884 RepID=A0A914PEA3_9BILA
MSQRKRRHDSEEPESRRRENEVEDGEVKRGETPEIPKKKEVDPILTRAGGAYIPPARLRMMMEQQADKKDETYQRMNWEKLKKKIHGQVNKVNVGNIVQVVRELLQENVIRGKGLLARSIIQAQTFSPSFSHVYAALVSIINSKFPNIGELIIRRLIIQFKRAFKNLNKATCVTVSTFLGHLANQRVVHELLILELLLVLMKDPTDDSIEIAVNLLKVCGQMLSQVTPQGTFAIFEQLRSILENCNDITSRTQYMIEVLFHVRKEKFISYPSVIEELDLIEEEDQVCHLVHIISEDDKPLDPETGLNVFKYDPNFEENEAQYDEIRQEIIGDADDSDEEEEGGGGGQPAADGGEDGEAEDTVKPLKPHIS